MASKPSRTDNMSRDELCTDRLVQSAEEGVWRGTVHFQKDIPAQRDLERAAAAAATASIKAMHPTLPSRMLTIMGCKVRGRLPGEVGGIWPRTITGQKGKREIGCCCPDRTNNALQKGHLVVTHFNGAEAHFEEPFLAASPSLNFNFPTCLPQCTPLPHSPPALPPDSRHCSTPLVSVILFIFAKALHRFCFRS